MAEGRFEGRAVIVTGGASGIGLAIVRRLVREGARVTVADASPGSLRTVAGELGEAVHTIELDVRDEARVATMVAETIERFGAPAAAFNVAGTNVLGDLVDLPEEDWDTVVDVCLKGVFLSLKHEARAMGEAGGGAIVNVASLNSRVPFPGGGAYACAKAGVEMLTRNAARELAPRRIRVNAVSPGLTDTPLVAPIRQVPGAEAAYLERIPMERWGRPEEMAAAALFLASDDASYVTGANLFVDGGWETTGYPDLRPLLAGEEAGG